MTIVHENASRIARMHGEALLAALANKKETTGSRKKVARDTREYLSGVAEVRFLGAAELAIETAAAAILVNVEPTPRQLEQLRLAVDSLR